MFTLRADEFEKIEHGDTVKIVDSFSSIDPVSKEMNKYLGANMVVEGRRHGYIVLYNDNGPADQGWHWYWYPNMIEKIVKKADDGDSEADHDVSTSELTELLFGKKGVTTDGT